MSKVALVLSGGGARGAYQAGVIRGLAQVTSRLGVRRPFPIMTGTSAGAVNVAYLAAHADDLLQATKRLAGFWRLLRSKDVYRTDLQAITAIGLQWMIDAVSGGHRTDRRARALLDTTPLAKLLSARIPFAAISGNLERGDLEAVAITATDYVTKAVKTYFMASNQYEPWQRGLRVGLADELSVAHVMASSAIPILFPPIAIHGHPSGDGCLRNNAPLSPAVRLGANKLVVVGVRHKAPLGSPEPSPAPIGGAPIDVGLARIFDVIINAILLDGVDNDIERMARINQTLALLPEASRSRTHLRPIDWLYIRPSRDLAHMAWERVDALPRTIRYLLSGLGSLAEAADLISYLLFEPSFIARAIELGYRDVIARSDEVAAFFS